MIRRDDLGTEDLSIHLEKKCSACIRELNQMVFENNDFNESARDAGAAHKAQGEPGQAQDIVAVESTSPDAPSAVLAPQDAILRHPETTPGPDDPSFEKTFHILSFLPSFKDQLMLTEEFKKDRRIKLFNDRTFYSRSLVTVDANGNKNYDDLIEYIKLLEEIVKDLKTCHQAADLARIGLINEASASERLKIAESDKKYAPKFKEREKAETEKMTAQEKKIRAFTAMGLSREAAEKIIFAK